MSSLFVDKGVPLLRGQNIRPYLLDLTNLKYISPGTHRKWKKSALIAGDVAIVRVGYPGTACVIPDGLGDLNAASLVIVRPNPRLLDSKFLCYVLNSEWGKGQIAGRLVGAAQQVFNTHTAAELEIPAPPPPVQRRITSVLSAYDELMENCQRRIRILEEMGRALYREWFVHFRFSGHEKVPHRRRPAPPRPLDHRLRARLPQTAIPRRHRSPLDRPRHRHARFLPLARLRPHRPGDRRHRPLPHQRPAARRPAGSGRGGADPASMKVRSQAIAVGAANQR